MATRPKKRSKAQALEDDIEEESSSQVSKRQSITSQNGAEFQEITAAVSKIVKKATAPLQDALNRSQANQIPSCVDGVLRHLLNMMMGDDIEMSLVVTSWNALMSKLPQLLRLNKLDVHISPTTLESLETPHLDSAKQRWAQGCKTRRNAKAGLESRIVGAAVDLRVLGKWVACADEMSYAKPYDLTTMIVMMAVVRVHHRLTLFNLGDQTSNTDINAIKTIADPLALSDLPATPDAPRSDTYRKWCDTNKRAIADGVPRIIGCAAFPCPAAAASSSSTTSGEAWIAFDILPASREIYVYKCTSAPSDPDCVSAFQRLAADLGLESCDVLSQKPFDIGGNELLASSTSVSGALAVGVVKILRTLPQGDIIRRSQKRFPARIDQDYVDRLSLTHHLDLISSHTCQTTVLELCRTGKVRIL